MAREITYNKFEISLVVFMPNITTNHAVTYTNAHSYVHSAQWGGGAYIRGCGKGGIMIGSIFWFTCRWSQSF